jgi:hypothetical protein
MYPALSRDAELPMQVKMVEARDVRETPRLIWLRPLGANHARSRQMRGAKPGKGGVLPKETITPEIAGIRGIPMGQDCHSPNRFEEFDDAASLLDFIARIRRLTGKPIGLKMVVGARGEIDELCRKIRVRGDGPDFIAVDGREGGSGRPRRVSIRSRRSLSRRAKPLRKHCESANTRSGPTYHRAFSNWYAPRICAEGWGGKQDVTCVRRPRSNHRSDQPLAISARCSEGLGETHGLIERPLEIDDTITGKIVATRISDVRRRPGDDVDRLRGGQFRRRRPHEHRQTGNDRRCQ